MQRVAWRVFFIGLLLNAVAIAQSQSQSGDSLGDAARANRTKQQAEETAGTTPKVITNHDLPSDPPGVPESSEPMTMVSGVSGPVDRYAERREHQQLMAEQRAVGQWQTRIQDQEARIADLQERIDRVNEAIHASIGTAQYETPVNRYQSIQMQRLAHMQEMLDQQNRKLATMQDAARHAGLGQ